MLQKQNLAEAFGNNKPNAPTTALKSHTDFQINNMMISDAGRAAFEQLSTAGYITNPKQWFLYATSADVRKKAEGLFLPENISYTGDLHPQLGVGANQDLGRGMLLAKAAWSKGNLEKIVLEMDAQSKITHVFLFAGGGSSFPVTSLITDKLKGATTNQVDLSSMLDSDEDFDLESLALGFKKYGIMVTIVVPSTSEGKKTQNYIEGLNTLLYDKDENYNPRVSYNLLKVDDMRTSSDATLSQEDILTLAASKFAVTNMVIKKFYTSEAVEGTDIDESEILNAIESGGEFIAGQGLGSDMLAAFADFDRSYKTFNAAATIKGASNVLALFEYPKSFARSSTELHAENMVVTKINSSAGIAGSPAIVKHSVSYGDVVQPTISLLYCGINAESKRADNARVEFLAGAKGAGEQLLRDIRVTEGVTDVPQSLNKSESALLREANKRVVTGTTVAGDKNKIAALTA